MTTTASTLGRHPADSAADPYARAADLDDATVAALAERIDIRAADPRQRRLWREAVARLPRVPGARVLEVGCGTGVVTELLAALPGVAEVIGVDPCPGFVDRARRRAPTLRFEVADGRALPLPDGSVDGVVFATTLCHVPDPGRALAEARRVLRPGGHLLVYDGDYATTTVALGPGDPVQNCVDAAIAALVHDPWLVRRLTPLVRDAGFAPGPLHSHGHVEVDSPAYLLSMVDVGVDALRRAGTLSDEAAVALRREARARRDTGRFFGHIAYASLVARSPGEEVEPEPQPGPRDEPAPGPGRQGQ